jgi:uncharacterized damage-inducible protein DinB
MTIGQSFVGEFEQEAATTRRCLERIPADKLAWKPHEKSMSAGDLAGHISNLMTNWVGMTMSQDVLDLNPPGGTPPQSPSVTSVAQLLTDFDAGLAVAKKAIVGAADARYMENWSLASGGKILLTMPRAAVIRTFVLNHVIHHRGQLSVYLRQMGVPVPSIYGPSADEGQMG